MGRRYSVKGLKKMKSIYKRDYINAIKAEDNEVTDYINIKENSIATKHDNLVDTIHQLED